MNFYFLNFYDVYFNIIEENISKVKKEQLVQCDRPGESGSDNSCCW